MDMNNDNVEQYPSRDIHSLDGENGEDVVVIEQADAAVWCDAHQEKFMFLMEEEVGKGNRTDMTFNPIGWTHIVDAMLLETGKKYTKDQCRQKFNNIRALYKDCKQILSETGVGYNSETGMIELEAERWVRLCKVLKHGKKIKKQGCKNYEQMVRIFGNTHATGKHVYPSTKPPKPHQVLTMPQVATHEAQIHNTEGNAGMTDVE
ncbi:L10-interacting MYB domain-containing protein-like [Cornus florida]|uniref:L10-interacting MYB domain-containing protein-like n=1 Tax=Cornus florida TaxID=4283 RepID=UPI002896A551|nr:L10-interacting MYB domain-containing protein-like [Cornus florida]